MDKDQLEFLQAMAEMGLVEKKKRHKLTSIPNPSRREEEVAEEPENEFLLAMKNLQVPEMQDDSAENQHRLRKLKQKPKVVPEEWIDLHGLTKEDALLQLNRFVIQHFTRSTASILVITGKGHHSGPQGPVIKPAVEEWIKRQGKRFIKAYAEAPRAFGGGGALVLYLKKS